MTTTAPVDHAQLNRAINRYRNQKTPVWMIDPRDALTDIRAVTGGTVTHLGRQDYAINPLHPCPMQAGEADASELARLLKFMARPVADINARYLQSFIHRFLIDRSDGTLFRGAHLSDLLTFLSQLPDTAVFAQSLRDHVSRHPDVMRVLDAPTQVNKGLIRQFSFSPVNQFSHDAVTLTLHRLAGIAARNSRTGLVLITMASPLDTTDLATAVWDSPLPSPVHHLRG